MEWGPLAHHVHVGFTLGSRLVNLNVLHRGDDPCTNTHLCPHFSPLPPLCQSLCRHWHFAPPALALALAPQPSIHGHVHSASLALAPTAGAWRMMTTVWPAPQTRRMAGTSLALQTPGDHPTGKCAQDAAWMPVPQAASASSPPSPSQAPTLSSLNPTSTTSLLPLSHPNPSS